MDHDNSFPTRPGRFPDTGPVEPDSTPVHLDDSVGWMAVEELLEEALRGINSQDPAHYISTMMPSRQAARASWGYPIAQRAHTQPALLGQLGGRRTASSAGRRPIRPTVRIRVRTADCRDQPAFDLIQDVVEDLIIEEDENEKENEIEGRDEVKILASIKSMTAPMAVKRLERDRLLKDKKRNLASSLALKKSLQKGWSQLMEKIHSVFSVGFIWHNAIRNIEGHYGTSVAAVFVFIQWLFLLNLMVFIVVATFIVLPQLIHGEPVQTSSGSKSSILTMTVNCSSDDHQMHDGIGLLQDFIQGTGWMTWTEMFYGYYQYDHGNKSSSASNDFVYNLPLAYILATLTYFGLCLALMLRNTAKGSRENLFTSKGRVNECCNIVFGGWDYCIIKEKKAGLRQEIISNEIKVIIEEEKLLELKKSRTDNERIILYSLRILINSFVICLLLLCGYLIYFVVYTSRKLLNQKMQSASSGDFVTLTIEFMPSIVITSLNIFVPFAFYRLVIFESYSPAFVINITLIRTVFLKLASIAVLITTLYNGVNNNDDISENKECKCWETYVGQQIYKLVIMDFATGMFITFFVHFPRMLIVTRAPYKVTKFVGQLQFDIPNNVLDIVYLQTLCWMGTFYSPLLPILNVIKCFVFFYIKEFSLFINCEPSRVTYRASKSNTLFTIVLLLSFIMAIVPVAYSIGEITPSTKCGPFMGLNTMWDVVPNTMKPWPLAAQQFVRYFGTAGFAIPVIMILILMIYFYMTMSSAHKQEIHLLQEQLLMEGRDKQYLLNRLRHVLAYRQSYIAPS